MLLVVTSGGDATADYLCGRLDTDFVPFVRFDSDTVPERVEISYAASRATLRLGTRWWSPDEITNVWYRRPKPLAFDLDMDRAERSHTLAEWAEALEGFFAHIPFGAWMNHPSSNACASHKIEQLTRASRHGLLVPPSIVTQDATVARRFWSECDGRVVVKPLAGGHLERDDPAQDTIIYTNRITEEAFADLALVENCPTLFQREVSKQMDVRICIIDDDLAAAGMEAHDRAGGQKLDIRRNNMADVEYRSVAVPEEVRKNILRLVKSYRLRFSAIDMAVDSDGQWWFFEINPNGQWAWLDLAGGFDIGASFIRSFSRQEAPLGTA